MPRLIFPRTVAIVAAITSLCMSFTGRGQDVSTPSASPAASQDASPAAAIELPAGPLSDQIRWIVAPFADGGTLPTTAEITAHMSPEFLAQVPVTQFVSILTQLAGVSTLLHIEPNSLVFSEDEPPSSASFSLVGEDNTGFLVNISVNPETGQISGLRFSPLAPPVAENTTTVSPTFPSNPISKQANWVWTTLTNGGEAVPASNIESHVAPSILVESSADQLAIEFAQLQKDYGPFAFEIDSLVISTTTSTAQFVVVGQDRYRLRVRVGIDPATLLITDLRVQPADTLASGGTPGASAVASPFAEANLVDTEVSFASENDTIYGSFMSPISPTSNRPAALIISGSGATDRDGNSGPYPLETNLNVARTLANAGIPSLRYDKLGSGKTGLGSHTSADGVTYTLFLQEARDAAAFLSTQPNVDPNQLILIGHSEGALFALALAQELAAAGTPPAALILLSPLGTRYLDLLRDQILPQFDRAVAAGQMTQAQADTGRQELAAIVESLRTTGTLPMTITFAPLKQLFAPSSVPFLVEIDKIDPATIAASLPPTLPVLIIHGAKDQQVTGATLARE